LIDRSRNCAERIRGTIDAERRSGAAYAMNTDTPHKPSDPHQRLDA
jgi:hypothetical protein